MLEVDAGTFHLLRKEFGFFAFVWPHAAMVTEFILAAGPAATGSIAAAAAPVIVAPAIATASVIPAGMERFLARSAATCGSSAC